MSNDYIPNVLADRYATQEMTDIFSDKGRIIAERGLWIAVMKGQRELGINIPLDDIENFEAAKERVNLRRIREIESVTKHDVMAKIRAFVEVAGAGQYIHLGMTSRDLTDNVEQMQVICASKLISNKYVSVLRHLIDKAEEYRDIILTGRSHHQPAELILLGRRFSMWAEELYLHLKDFIGFVDTYPLRGLKGTMGTQSQMLNLLGSEEAVERLENAVANHLGFSTVLDSPGQVYPRSLDYSLISRLALLASSPENFAKGMRLMAGYELATEGFSPGQVGSSAMPHKMNTRSSERVCSLAGILKMHANGASRISGDQWEEGDVSCSAIRRAIIPDSFYASDGLCETVLTVLNNMGPYPEVIAREVDKYLPFLISPTILTLATQLGIGRETAHEEIKAAMVEGALALREGNEQNIVETLAKNPLFEGVGIDRRSLEDELENQKQNVGRARTQIDKVSTKAMALISANPEAAAYEPKQIL